MEKILYLECESGISGDMTVGALLDLGADRTVLKKALDSLPVTGFHTEISRVKKSGLDACDFSVVLDAEHENHDHDMEYLYGHTHPGQDHEPGQEHELVQDHEHMQEHGHAHSHGHVHSHGHTHACGHSHEHRGLWEILDMIRRADMTDHARSLAEKIFRILGAAEAKAHGVPEEQVHFHEVGAVDSIVDIVSAAVCLDSLGISKVILPRLCEGQGTVRCQHGIIPVPVPAVVNIASAYGLSLHVTEVQGELVTPTGAAIAAAIRTGTRLPEDFVIEKVGLGAGKRSYERPGILRAMLITPAGGGAETDRVCRLETNIDDCTGEALGHVMDKLFLAGARDVHYTPVFMKKNRPAYQLNVICSREDREKLEEIIFSETTTIGIRRMEMERTVLKRECRRINTSLGEAGIKTCTLPNGTKRVYPEYRDVVLLSEKNTLPYQEAYAIIKAEAERSIAKEGEE